MEEKYIIKLSRRIEYLVHKRHRSLRHIQKALVNEGQGVFWMNSVHLDRAQLSKIMQQQFSAADLKTKTERFYYLGFSLGKIIDLGNAVNTIYTLLQLFEEYEIYTKQQGGSINLLENNAILRHILPMNIESLSKVQQSQEKRIAQLEEYVDSLSATSATDNFQSTDNIDTVRQPNFQDISSPNQLRAGGHLNHHSQPPVNQNHHEEAKIDLRHKNALLMNEKSYNNYDEYIRQTSQLSSQFHQHFGGQQAESGGTRIHPSKVDPKAPSFKVFSCHTIPMRLEYCDVASVLIDMLILVYNKMYDNQYLNQVMLNHIEKIDNIIVVRSFIFNFIYQNKVIKTFCEDINKVARVIAVKQLAKINKVLKMDTTQGSSARTDLKKVPSDDNLFQIVALDLQGNNQQDFLLLNSVVSSSGQLLKASQSDNQMSMMNSGNTFK